MKTNLEIIKGIYLGDAQQNATNLEAVLAPQFEWREAAGFPYTGSFHNFDEVAKNLFAPLATEWTGFRAHVDNFFDAGATIVNVPDTVGYQTPAEYGQLIRTLRERLKNAERITISTHCHDDLGGWKPHLPTCGPCRTEKLCATSNAPTPKRFGMLCRAPEACEIMYNAVTITNTMGKLCDCSRFRNY